VKMFYCNHNIDESIGVFISKSFLCVCILSKRLCFDCVLGVLGIKIKIMLPWDPTGKIGPKRPLPDHVSILDPKDQALPEQPYSEQKGAKPAETPLVGGGGAVPKI